MLCEKPRVAAQKNGKPQFMYACGQCTPCRINTRRKKTCRGLLEARGHEWSTFVTLTIEDEHLEHTLDVDGAPIPTLVPNDLRLYLRGMRKRIPELRYIAVGEYGTESERPHYHALFFGHDPMTVGQATQEVWRYGYVTASEANAERIAYICGYTVKKYMREVDPNDRRVREFSRWSSKPLIGEPSLDWLEELCYTRGGAELIAETGDAPSVVRIGGKVWPLDRSMRLHLRKRLGLHLSDPLRASSREWPTWEERKSAISAAEKAERREKRRGVL